MVYFIIFFLLFWKILQIWRRKSTLLKVKSTKCLTKWHVDEFEQFKKNIDADLRASGFCISFILSSNLVFILYLDKLAMSPLT